MKRMRLADTTVIWLDGRMNGSYIFRILTLSKGRYAVNQTVNLR